MSNQLIDILDEMRGEAGLDEESSIKNIQLSEAPPGVMKMVATASRSIGGKLSFIVSDAPHYVVEFKLPGRFYVSSKTMRELLAGGVESISAKQGSYSVSMDVK